ncbi:hypothetical protein, partial [Segatella baroniae]|uniref:hypothetical protein n=1 Tax=Segatella baroniae TaxID=305719 RepID=UPI0036F3977A
MSKIRFPPFAQAPNNPPSVPTFCPHRSCLIVKRLKENEFLPMLFVVVNHIVHEVHHGFGHLKNPCGFLQPA